MILMASMTNRKLIVKEIEQQEFIFTRPLLCIKMRRQGMPPCPAWICLETAQIIRNEGRQRRRTKLSREDLWNSVTDNKKSQKVASLLFFSVSELPDLPGREEKRVP